MTSIAEISWLTEICTQAHSPTAAVDTIIGSRGAHCLLRELLCFRGDCTASRELQAIDAMVHRENETEDDASPQDRAQSGQTTAAQMAALLSPFVAKHRTTLERLAEVVRTCPFPLPSGECDESVPFVRDDHATTFRYWRWGQLGSDTALALIYADGDLTGMDVMDRIGDGALTSLHTAHGFFLKHWPELLRVPRWYLRVRYEASGLPNERWLRFTDAQDIPVAWVLGLVAASDSKLG